jgi:hypothetical protein
VRNGVEKLHKSPITGEKSMTWRAHLKIIRKLFDFNSIKLKSDGAMLENREKSRFCIPMGAGCACKKFYPVPGGTSRYEAVRPAIFAAAALGRAWLTSQAGQHQAPTTDCIYPIHNIVVPTSSSNQLSRHRPQLQ